MAEPLPPLIDAAWLIRHAGEPDIAVLDASWYLPAEGRDPDAEFRAGHIAGARRFDFDDGIADPRSPLPHMLPPASQFEAEVRALGIDRESRVVCYDGAGIFAAPRAWWMFRAMGHGAVTVLDGGLTAWIAAGGPLETGEPGVVSPGTFVARPDAGLVKTAAQVRAALESRSAHILDARSEGRFTGVEAEARPGLRSGHMPGARNLPFDRLLNGGRFRDPAELRQAFEDVGVDSARPIIASCGSGVTASVLALGAAVAGLDSVAVYDGSWAEWGQASRPDLPVVTGGAAG